MRTYQPTDEEEWLEFRRQHLTSTNLRDLHLTKTAANWQRLRREKETGEQPNFPSFLQELMGWGKAREPELAKHALHVDSRLRYNADPQTIWVGDDERLSCTPDLYSDGDVIGEIKTSTKPLAGGRYSDWCPDTYWLQCQWNMHLMEMDACVLIFEPHDNFHPGPVQRHVIEYDRKTIADLKQTAAEWFAWVEDDENPGWMGDVDNPELEALVGDYGRLDKEIKRLTEEKNTIRGTILGLVDGSIDGDFGDFHLTVSAGGVTRRFDSKGFKKAHPELHAEFLKETKSAPRLTVKER